MLVFQQLNLWLERNHNCTCKNECVNVKEGLMKSDISYNWIYSLSMSHSVTANWEDIILRLSSNG